MSRHIPAVGSQITAARLFVRQRPQENCLMALKITLFPNAKAWSDITAVNPDAWSTPDA